MAFQSAPACAEMVIAGTVGAKAVVNVLNFRYLGVYTQTNIDELASLGDISVGAAYLALMTSGMSYDSVTVRGLTEINDLTATASTEAGAGLVTGAQLNNNVTLCITLRTGLTGRSARGRFYAFPTGASNLEAANQFSSTYATGLETFLNDLRTEALDLGWQMIILSRFTNKAARPEGIGFVVTTAEARNRISDSQRGRLPAGH